MNIIAAAQRSVTAVDVDPITFDTEAGQDALRDILADLETTADSAVDIEDLDHYRSLLGGQVLRFARRSAGTAGRGAAA